MQTLKKGTIDSHYLPNYPCIVDSESHSNPFYMYPYYVYIYIIIYVLHIFDDANCIPIMIPIVDGESNVCSFLLSMVKSTVLCMW